MYHIMETSITQHIMLKEGNVCLTYIYLQLKTWYYHVHIPKDMYLHDIPVGKKMKLKFLTTIDFMTGY